MAQGAQMVFADEDNASDPHGPPGRGGEEGDVPRLGPPEHEGVLAQRCPEVLAVHEDKRAQWLEVRDGFNYCTLCGHYATEGHIASEKHQRRIGWLDLWDNPEEEWEQEGPEKEWIEVRGGFNFCTLCHLYATDGHLNSRRHRKRREWQQGWDQTDEVQADPSLGPPAHWGDPTHFLIKNGWWWCRLCGQWASNCHVKSQRHWRRAEFPDWYAGGGAEGDGTYGGNGGLLAIDYSEWGRGAKGRQAAPPPAHPEEPWGPDFAASFTGRQQAQARTATTGGAWVTAYSSEYDRNYYWNQSTGESTWELPAGAEAASSSPGGATYSTNGACASTAVNGSTAGAVAARSAAACATPSASAHGPGAVGVASHSDVQQAAAGAGSRTAAAAVSAGYGKASVEGWRREYSEEHKRFYFWNEAENESCWDLPANATADAAGDVSWV